MILYSDMQYQKIKTSSTKHMIIGKKKDVYHFWIRRLVTNKKISGWKTIYSRKRCHIIEKEFLFSQETINTLMFASNNFDKWNTQINR